MAEVNIDLRGSAADFIREMQKVVDSLEDVERAAGGAGDEVDEATSATGAAASGMDTLKRGAIALGAAIGAARVRDFVVDSTNLAIAAEEAGNKFDATFGPAAAALGREMDALSDKAGVTDFRFRDMVASTGNVIQGLGGSEQEAARLAAALAPLAVDVASFNGSVGDSDEALRSMTSALTGNRESLKDRWGIVVREAEVIQRALNNTFKESADDLTELEKATATFELITERAGRAVGDLDRNLDSAATQQARMRAEWEEMQVTVGNELLPVMLELAPAVTGVTEALAALAPVLGNVLGGIAENIAPLAEFVGNIAGLTTGIEDATAAMPGWVQAFGTGVSIVLKLLTPLTLVGRTVDWINGRFEVAAKGSGELTKELENQTDAQGDLDRATRRSGVQHGAWERSVLGAVDAIKALISNEQELAELRNKTVTQLSQMRDAQDRLADARNNLTNVQADATASAIELRDAAWEVVEAEAALAALSADFAAGAGPSYTDALIDIGREAGLAGDALWAFVDAAVAATGVTSPGGAISVVPIGVTPVPQQHGGIHRARRGGRVVQVAEGGDDEAVIPLNQQGAEFIRSALGNGNGNGAPGPGITIIVQGFVGSELDLAAELDRLLTRRSRASGLGF